MHTQLSNETIFVSELIIKVFVSYVYILVFFKFFFQR